MGLFWRRKKEDQFVSLRLNEPAATAPTSTTPEPSPQPEAKPEPPVKVAEPAPVPSRSPFQTSVLGLNLSMEELQAQEAALEQEFSNRFRRAVAATRDTLSERLDTVFAGRKQIDDELLDQLEEVLIAADIGVPTTLDILENVRRGVARKQINDIEALKQAIKIGRASCREREEMEVVGEALEEGQR